MTAVFGCASYGQVTDTARRGLGATPRPVTFIRDIPLRKRQEICQALDASHAWINLAALLNFKSDDVQNFKKALYRIAGSPTDDMLTVWDYGCHTVTELYHKLFEMKHARCMMIIKDFVDPNLHHLIQEVQGVQPGDDDNASAANIHPGHPQMPPIMYVPGGHAPDARNFQTLPHPEQPQATQGSWNSANQNRMSSSSDPAKPQKESNFPQKGERSEGLTANINKDTSEKVIGLGSPLKNWHGTSGSSTSVNNKSGVKGELTSGDIGGMASGQVLETGDKEKLENYQNQSALSLLIHISHGKISQATNGFDGTYKLGEGSFGTVYHAVINMTHYAVKRMKQNDYMGFETNKIARADQMKELRALVTYRNPYIVSLCAYSLDGPSPCLIYEFMENGSLEDNLLCRAQRGPLDWRTRHKIAEGAALGINFLHKAQEQPLIHGDIKSANILLGKHMEPKIADFGLARLGPENGKTYCYLKTKNAHGTLPYLPEEFKRSFKLSTKVDVYSFGVVLMEILAGERVADSRREPNKLLTDLIDDILTVEKDQQAQIEQIRDRRCPDWPWDIARHLLDLAVKCTVSIYTKRPEIDEAVNILRNIAAEIARRDMIQKQREDFYAQDPQQRSPEGFYGQPRHEERGTRYPPPNILARPQGQGEMALRREWSIESNNSVTGLEMLDPRYRVHLQQQKLQQGPLMYEPGYKAYPQSYNPSQVHLPGVRRHMSSETSDDNNVTVDEKVLDMPSSLSSLTSYDLPSQVCDPSLCVPLLYPSQSLVSSTVDYHRQQSYPNSPPVFDPRQPHPSHQYPSGYPRPIPQHYPQQDPRPLHDSWYHLANANARPIQNTISSLSMKNQQLQDSPSLHDHLKQLDISQLPTKPVGDLPARDTEHASNSQGNRPPQQVPVTTSSARKEPEQNTDILPGYGATMKEKSVRPMMISTISEESEDDESHLRSSLTTAEMNYFLAGKPREATQQTEKMNNPTSPKRQGTFSSRAGTQAAMSESADKACPLKTSLTTVQMKQFLPSKREPTEEAEDESSTNRLDRGVKTPQCSSAKALSETPDPHPRSTKDQNPSCLEAPPCTTRNKRDVRELVAELNKALEESQKCYSAPPNMAPPISHEGHSQVPRREPQQMTEPLNNN